MVRSKAWMSTVKYVWDRKAVRSKHQKMFDHNCFGLSNVSTGQRKCLCVGRAVDVDVRVGGGGGGRCRRGRQEAAGQHS